MMIDRGVVHPEESMIISIGGAASLRCHIPLPLGDGVLLVLGTCYGVR